jgi:hypothetical protein
VTTDANVEAAGPGSTEKDRAPKEWHRFFTSRWRKSRKVTSLCVGPRAVYGEMIHVTNDDETDFVPADLETLSHLLRFKSRKVNAALPVLLAKGLIISEEHDGEPVYRLPKVKELTERYRDRRAETSPQNGLKGGRNKNLIRTYSEPNHEPTLEPNQEPTSSRASARLRSASVSVSGLGSDSKTQEADPQAKAARRRSGDDGFDGFWADYPRKQKLPDARKAWASLSPSPELQHRILAHVAAQKNSEDWRRERGKFVPLPASYLRGERWLDEAVVQVKPLPKASLAKPAYQQRRDDQQDWEDAQSASYRSVDEVD